MDRRTALLVFAAWGVAAAGASLFAGALARPAVPVAGFAVSAFLLGPAFLLLLLPHARASPVRWVRRAATIVPGLAVVGASYLTIQRAQFAAATGEPLLSLERGILLHAGLLALVSIALVAAHRRGDLAEWRTAALWMAPFALLAAIPATADLPLLALVALEAAAFVSLTGFRRAPSAWLQASGAALAVALVGLLTAIARQGSFRPLRLVLDGSTFYAVAMPVSLLAAATFLGILLLAQPPPAATGAAGA